MLNFCIERSKKKKLPKYAYVLEKWIMGTCKNSSLLFSNGTGSETFSQVYF